MSRAKHERARQWALSGLALQIPEEMMERRRRAEQAYTMVRGELGRGPGLEGTFDQPGAQPAPTTTPAPGAPQLFENVGILGSAGMMPGAAGLMGPRQMISPEAILEYQRGTIEHKIMDELTREAAQLVKGEGPAWEKLHQSVMGPIIEGSAAMMRDQAEALRRDLSKGGMRASQARESMMKIRMQEAANTQRQHNLWNANLSLHQWTRENARMQVTEFNTAYAQNVGGVRDSFLNSMDQAGRFMVESAIPIAADRSLSALSISQMSKAQSRGKKNKILKIGAGALMAAAGAITMNPGLATMGLQVAAGGIMGDEAAGQFGPQIGAAGGVLAQPREGGVLGGLQERVGGRIMGTIGGILGSPAPTQQQLAQIPGPLQRTGHGGQDFF